MKTKPQSSAQQQSGSSRPNRGPQVPPRNSQPQESPRPSSGARYDQRGAESPPRRSNSTRDFRKGFMPNTPGGDEPAASKGAYFTQQYKSAVPPDLPAREPKSASKPSRAEPDLQYRSSQAPPAESRISTPYAGHGGEKLNPFESASVNRSKSARESPQRYSSDAYAARPDSSTNLFGEVPKYNNPQRSQSTRASSRHQQTSSVDIDTDSSGSGPELKSFGKSRPKASETNGTSYSQPARSSASQPKNKIDQYQQWYRNNPNADFPDDAYSESSRSKQQQPQQNPPIPPKTPKDGEPSMYDHSNTHQRSGVRRSSTWANPLPTVSESSPVRNSSSKKPYYMSAQSPSGEDSPLTDFEIKQRGILDQILYNKSNRRVSSSPNTTPLSRQSRVASNQECEDRENVLKTQASSRESPAANKHSIKVHSRKARVSSISQAHHSYSPTQNQNQSFWQSLEEIKNRANETVKFSSFSFNVNEDSFNTTAPRRPSLQSFNSSAENISTKFNTKAWDGKFAGEHFQPDPKAPFQPARSQSGSSSRSRNRSPPKPTVDPRHPQTRAVDGEPTVESPGGTKFSAQEWADTFRPQTFAPPPPRQVPTRKRTGTSLRPTLGGNAAVVDDGSSADEKPLFDKPKTPVTPNAPSTPDAMDIDPPPARNTVPQFMPPPQETAEPPHSPKRPAASPVEDASLKVNFSELNIRDLLSTLSLPNPPSPPPSPQNLPNTQPSAVTFEDYAVRFAKYMTAWDLYNNQFLLHLVTRKNQNDGLGQNRWLKDDGLQIYRQGLKEDAAVLEAWKSEKEKHEVAVREWMTVRDGFKEGERRTRTKTG